MIKIVQKEDKVLREIAKDIPKESISSAKIQGIIRDMKTALASQDDGVAIAAPQIGKNLRIFVVSGKVFSIMEDENADHVEILKQPAKYPDMVFINPKITKLSSEKKWMEEGCLSVRYLYGKVRRSAKATINAYDENGKFFTRGGSGILAQIFQHETDHLDGMLFTDKAKDVEDMPPTK